VILSRAYMITLAKAAINTSSDVPKLQFSLLSATYRSFRRSTYSSTIRYRDEILRGDQTSATEIQAIPILNISFPSSYTSKSIERKVNIQA